MIDANANCLESVRPNVTELICFLHLHVIPFGMYQFTASEACLQPKLDQDLSSCTYKAGVLSADSKHLVDFESGERLPVVSRPVIGR